MSKSNGIVCDGCDVVCKTMQSDYPHSITYISIREFSRTRGVFKRKYHLCETDCTPEWFQEDDDGREIGTQWIYDMDKERITGANWLVHHPYCEGDSFEKARDEFPDRIERMAQHIEEKIYDE